MEWEVLEIGKGAGVANLVGSGWGVGASTTSTESTMVRAETTAGPEVGSGGDGSLHASNRPAASKETRAARPAMRKGAFPLDLNYDHPYGAVYASILLSKEPKYSTPSLTV